MTKSCFSPGKVILSGEHSVVYGKPALVSTINLGIKINIVDACVIDDKKPQKRGDYLEYIFAIFKTRCLLSDKLSLSKQSKRQNIDISNLEIHIESNLPPKSGLGSSAAFAHAVFLCLLDYFNIELSQTEIFKLVLEAENFIHGSSSGVDPSAVVFGGVQVFQKVNNKFKRKHILSNFKKSSTLLKFTLINSGLAQETTGEMVSLVRSRVESNKKIFKIIKKMGQVTTNLIKSINDQKFNPFLISQNQKLLEDLGVVGKKAKKIVKEIESIGGFAKITGAGGIKKGSGWLLVYHPNSSELESFITKNNLESYRIIIK